MKANAALNGEWGKHITKFEKRLTSKKRRKVSKKEIEKA
jgi:hypothetical protein